MSHVREHDERIFKFLSTVSEAVDQWIWHGILVKQFQSWFDYNTFSDTGPKTSSSFDHSNPHFSFLDNLAKTLPMAQKSNHAEDGEATGWWSTRRLKIAQKSNHAEDGEATEGWSSLRFIQ